MQVRFDGNILYCFGCSTCNSWPFFFKIVANEAYLQGLHRSNSNQAKLVQTGSYLLVFFWFSISWNGPTATESPFFSGSMDWTFNPYEYLIIACSHPAGNSLVVLIQIERHLSQDFIWTAPVNTSSSSPINFSSLVNTGFLASYFSYLNGYVSPYFSFLIAS